MSRRLKLWEALRPYQVREFVKGAKDNLPRNTSFPDTVKHTIPSSVFEEDSKGPDDNLVGLGLDVDAKEETFGHGREGKYLVKHGRRFEQLSRFRSEGPDRSRGRWLKDLDDPGEVSRDKGTLSGVLLRCVD